MRRLESVSRRYVYLISVLTAFACSRAFGQQSVPIDILALPLAPQGTTIVAAPGSSAHVVAGPVLAAPARPILQLPPPPTTTSQVASNTAVALPAASLPPTTAATPEASMSPETMAALSQTVRAILVESLPERIEKNDDWGEQRERLSQFKPKFDGLRLRVETTTKPVNHGLWKQLVVVPVDPQRNLRFQIVEARGAGRNGVVFQVVVFAPLKVTARVERWRTGIKLVNFSTDADASVEMRLAGEVQYEYTVENGTRYLKFLPRVRAVDMKLVEFDLRRISLAAGPLVQDLGDMVTNPLADQLDKHEPKIVEKLNKSIVKRQDRLKIPVSLPFDWSDWSWSKS